MSETNNRQGSQKTTSRRKNSLNRKRPNKQQLADYNEEGLQQQNVRVSAGLPKIDVSRINPVIKSNEISFQGSREGNPISSGGLENKYAGSGRKLTENRGSINFKKNQLQKVLLDETPEHANEQSGSFGNT